MPAGRHLIVEMKTKRNAKQPATKAVPLYLSGAITKGVKAILEGDAAQTAPFGRMRTPHMGNKVEPGPAWGADTGCYSQKGERAYNEERYFKWLSKQDAATCLFATAPDRVGDSAVTLTRSVPVLPKIRKLGLPAGFVIQEGAEEPGYAIPWDDFDVLFIGGCTEEWKLSDGVAALVREAKRRGKWVHMGRVNTLTRYRGAMRMGCDSVDGTMLAWGPIKNLPKLRRWQAKLAAEAAQGELALVA